MLSFNRNLPPMSDSFVPPKKSYFPANALGFLVLLNIVIYSLQVTGHLLEYRQWGDRVKLMQFGSLAREDLVERYEFWRLFTYMVVHDIKLPWHIGLNLLMVFFCGWVVQNRLGGVCLIAIYVLGGLLGGLAHVLLFGEPLIGASASAYALLVAVGVLMAKQRVKARPGFLFRWRIRVKYLVRGVLIVTVISFFIDLIAGPEADIPMISNVGHLAHLGGALAGYLFCAYFRVGRELTLADLQAQRAARESGVALPPPPPGGFNGGSMLTSSCEPTPLSMTDLDPILDKIAIEGFQNLSDEERDTLQRSFRLMSRT